MSLAGGFAKGFSLNAVTGELTTSAVLDREDTEFYNLTVYVTDKADSPLTGQRSPQKIKRLNAHPAAKFGG